MSSLKRWWQPAMVTVAAVLLILAIEAYANDASPGNAPLRSVVSAIGAGTRDLLVHIVRGVVLLVADLLRWAIRLILQVLVVQMMRGFLSM